ncbi:MAG: ATP-binding protein [Candidatus Hadarchaeales archaeon]
MDSRIFSTLHAICNLLAAISMAAEMLKSRCDDVLVEEIKEASERATLLLKDLILSPELPLETINLNELILKMEGEILQVLGEGIELVLELASDLQPIRASGKQVERILMNLVKNARDAMPSGGQLIIRTENCSGSVCLMVRDTGVGIRPEVMGRIFEPFFTTRERGVGLGLSVVRRAVEEIGGKIEVESKEGEGTTFRVFIPVG